MSIVIPYSDTTKYATGGILAPTASIFTGLKSFFKCSETSGTTLADSISGAVYTPGSSTLTFITNGAAISTNTVQSITGTIPNIGTSNFLMLAVCQSSGNSFTVGYGDPFNGTNPNIGFYISGGVFRSYVSVSAGVIDTSTGISTDTTTVHGFAIKGVWNTALTELTVTNFVDSTNTPQSSASTALGALNWTAATQVGIKNVTKIYSQQLYLPSSMPSNGAIQSMLAWLTYQHVAGNKYIYPALKGF